MELDVAIVGIAAIEEIAEVGIGPLVVDPAELHCIVVVAICLEVSFVGAGPASFRISGVRNACPIPPEFRLSGGGLLLKNYQYEGQSLGQFLDLYFRDPDLSLVHVGCQAA